MAKQNVNLATECFHSTRFNVRESLFGWGIQATGVSTSQTFFPLQNWGGGCTTLHKEVYIITRIKNKSVPTPMVLYVSNMVPQGGHTKLQRGHRWMMGKLGGHMWMMGKLGGHRWMMGKLGGHSNFWVGQRNFLTVWTNFFKFNTESKVLFSPAFPAAKKAKIYFAAFRTSYLVK